MAASSRRSEHIVTVNWLSSLLRNFPIQILRLVLILSLTLTLIMSDYLSLEDTQPAWVQQELPLIVTLPVLTILYVMVKIIVVLFYVTVIKC